jgi:hypothetical protein
MKKPRKLLIEVMHKSKACLSCVYMEETVQQVLPAYAGKIIYSRVDLSSPQGAKRFLELSCSLFGEEGVYKFHRLAPVPSLFINAELVFDAIPSQDELEEAIEAYTTQKA